MSAGAILEEVCENEGRKTAFDVSELRSINFDELDFDELSDVVKAEFEFDLTELGNGKRLAKILGGKIRWLVTTGKFVHFKKGRWIEDNSGLVTRAWEFLLDELKDDMGSYSRLMRAVTKHSDRFKTEELQEVINRKLKELWAHHKRSQGRQVIKNSIDLFKAQPGITLTLETFDCKGWYLGCRNGVVDLRSGNLVDHDQSYLMMKSARVEFDPEAECVVWNDFLDKAMEGDPEKKEFLQLIAGQMLIGEDCKDKLLIFIGDGANGKSVFLDTLTEILGDYAVQASPDLLTSKAKQNEYHIANLQGTRAVTMIETRRGDKLEESVVKMMVDSGMVSARFPFGRPFQFQPVFTPILCTNYMPYISMDPALWRRLIIVPFTYTIPPAERDPGFKQRLLKEERSGIFNWMVEGAKKFYACGKLVEPHSLIRCRDQYKIEFDNLLHFFIDCKDEYDCNPRSSSLSCEITALRVLYQEWCQKNGYHALNTRSFRSELQKRNLVIKKGPNGRTHVYGIGIIGEGESAKLIGESSIFEF